MLVLSRKLSEKLYLTVPPSGVSTEIVVVVTDIDRNKIRIGIQAPREVDIMREELIPLHQREAGE